MQQLEIEYFFPLTEQIPLDLDYEPSKLYAKELNRQRCIEGSSGQFLISVLYISKLEYCFADLCCSFRPGHRVEV